MQTETTVSDPRIKTGKDRAPDQAGGRVPRWRRRRGDERRTCPIMTNVDRKTFEVFQRQAAERGMTLSGYAAELIGSGISGIRSEEAELRTAEAA